MPYTKMETPEYIVTQKHHDGTVLNYIMVECAKCLSSFITRKFEIDDQDLVVTYKCPVCNENNTKSYLNNRRTPFGRVVRSMLKGIKCSGHAVVGKSPVHGNGIFATEDIKAGEYICEYGGDIVSQDDSHTKYSDNLYTLNISSNYVIIGHQVPKDPMKIGQLINDFATFDNEGTDIIEKYYFYKNKSSDGANVTFVRVGKFKMLIKAIKDIKKGEELFVSYGGGYWNSSETQMYRKYKKDFHFYNECIKIQHPDVEPGSKKFFEELKSMLRDEDAVPIPSSEEEDFPTEDEDEDTENEDNEETK